MTALPSEQASLEMHDVLSGIASFRELLPTLRCGTRSRRQCPLLVKRRPKRSLEGPRTSLLLSYP
jgi:hypothetical protein